jgi:AcrR family transcriptional regulator
MRVKTEERRQAILAAAAEVFRETGYERASMAEISARVGGSKTTLYSYFKSKEELFAAVMTDAMEAQADRVFALLDQGSADVEVALKQYARAYIEVLLRPDFLAFMRVGIAEGANGGLGPLLYELGPKAVLQRLADFLQSHMSAERLREADPWLAALHLKGLLEAGIVEPILHGRTIVVDRDDALEKGVQVFLRAYGLNQLSLWALQKDEQEA